MKKIVKSFATVTLLSVITRLMSFVFKIYLSRKLGAEILGLYQICTSMLMLLACFACSGLPVTLSRITAECGAAGNVKSERGAFSTCITVGLMLSAFIMTATIAFPSVLQFFFTDERCVRIFYIMLPMLITTTFYSIVRGWFWGKKDFVVYSVSEMADEILKIVLSVLLFCGLFGISSLSDAYAIAMLIGDVLVTIGLGIVFFVKGGRFAKPSMTKPILKSALPLTTTRVVGSLMSTFMALMLPSLLCSGFGLTTSEATAEFGRASGMVMPLIFTPSSVIGSLGVVLIPEIASSNVTGQSSKLGERLSDSLKLSCIVSGLFFALFAGLGPQLGNLLYDDAKAGVYLRFAAVLMFPMGINNLTVSMLNSLGKENQTFITHVCSCVVLAALIFLLPRYVGIYAYFIGLGAFHTISMAANLVLLNKRVPLGVKPVFQSLGAALFSVVLAFGLYFMNGALNRSLPPIASCAVCALIGAVIYALYVLLTKTFDVSAYLGKRGAPRRARAKP